MKIHLRTIEELIVLPLILNVFADDILIDPDGIHEVSARPETLLGERSFPGEYIVGADGTFAFEETHDVCHGVLGRDFEHEMDMIRAGIALQDFYFFLLGEFPDDFSNLDADGSIENFLAVLWYNDDVVFAVPYHMAL